MAEPGERLTCKPPPGCRTLPAQRKVYPSGPGRLRRPRDSESLNSAQPSRNPSREDERKYPVIPTEDLPPALPPKSPQILRKASSLSRSQSMPSRGSPAQLRPPGLLKPSGETETTVRSRSQTPCKVTFQAEIKSEEKPSFEWVDFKSDGISLSIRTRF